MKFPYGLADFYSLVQAAFTAARSALVAYRDTLQTKYGARLKLRVYAIVSLAFEQVLWEDVEE